ncbi:MAG: polysaccharide biosynthesis/export family protein, partial [Gemmataceae bacterium]|nr:polysaccharide biosynthesis/export family protein [Gemmataceae bacterium]
MGDSTSAPHALSRPRRSRVGLLLLCAGPLLAASGSGCAALTNPVAQGVPVRRLPPEMLAHPKNGEVSIPLTLLRQPPQPVYRLAPGDVLGVWIEGILGDRALVPPLHVPPPVLIRDQRRLAPALGYPIPVAENGTITLPLIDPVPVRGLSVAEAHRLVRDTYTKKGLLKAGEERVFVSLLQPRVYQVLVLRQESPAFLPGPEGVVSTGKRGTGNLIELPAGENDILHALTVTGGLPGLDAYNAVIVFRGCFIDGTDGAALLQGYQANPASPLAHAVGRQAQVIRIPLRAHPYKVPPIRPEDVVLRTGDVVYLEARDQDIYYTGGLLPGGEHILPRDRDLDVVGAIARVRGPLLNGSFSTSNLAGNLVNPGMGNPSATLLTVIRQLPGGGQVPIKVDLALALNDPRERLLVKAGDVLILQEKPQEALARYISTSFFNFSVAWQVVRSQFINGVVDV